MFEIFKRLAQWLISSSGTEIAGANKAGKHVRCDTNTHKGNQPQWSVWKALMLIERLCDCVVVWLEEPEHLNLSEFFHFAQLLIDHCTKLFRTLFRNCVKTIRDCHPPDSFRLQSPGVRNNPFCMRPMAFVYCVAQLLSVHWFVSSR